MMDVNWLVRQKVAYVAESNIGYGESGGNNHGNFIHAIGGVQGQEWCGTFAGYCYERGYELAKLDMPFARSQGAKRLLKNLASAGTYLDKPRIGDLACWSRGVLGWQGHVGVVVGVGDGWFETVEGNVRGRVCRVMHRYGEPKFWRFAGLR